MKYEHDELFSKLFKQDIVIPQNTLDVLDKVCANLEDHPADTSDKRYLKTGKRSFVILVAAIISTMLFAGSVLAYGLINPQFYQSLFGTGISGNEDDRTYITADGQEALFPLNERVSVSDVVASEVVGEYVQIINKSVILDEITITVNEFIIDVNGMGYLTYTVSCPSGLEDILDVYYLDFVATSFLHSYFINGEICLINDRAFINKTASSANRAYIIQPFSIPFPISDNMDLSIGFYQRGQAIDTCERISLPINKQVPSTSLSSDSKGHVISLSPLGMTIECTDHDSALCQINELVLFSATDEYVVLNDSTDNKLIGTYWVGADDDNTPESTSHGKASYLFNRLVVPENISKIALNNENHYPKKK